MTKLKATRHEAMIAKLDLDEECLNLLVVEIMVAEHYPDRAVNWRPCTIWRLAGGGINEYCSFEIGLKTK
jgi:hypothetical protein